VNSIVIEATKGWAENEVESVKLLGSQAEVTWSMTPEGLELIPPADLGKSDYAWSFEIVTNSERHAPNAIQSDASKALKGTKKVDLDGAH